MRILALASLLAFLASQAHALQSNGDTDERIENEAHADAEFIDDELRDLLSQPPNAKTQEIADDPQSQKIQNAVSVRRAEFREAMNEAARRQTVFNEEPVRFSVEGDFTQGGLVFGQTEAGASVRLDGEEVMVSSDGRFVIGFARDAPTSSLIVVSYSDGEVERRAFQIEAREFPVQRIDGLDQSKVSGFTKEQLAKIAADTAKKKAARKTTQSAPDWADGFDWPAMGPISGVFGSQRILNGEAKRPHSGVDIAAPEGTPVRAPASGVITLAQTDMYFEGGLILLDHGHWVESAFLHLSQINVEPGARVEKGEIIGAVGATGRVTGPHLHWSMKWAGRLVDPQLAADRPMDDEKAMAD